MHGIYAMTPQILGIPTRDTLNFEHIRYPPYAILRKFTRKGAAVFERKSTGDATAPIKRKSTASL